MILYCLMTGGSAYTNLMSRCLCIVSWTHSETCFAHDHHQAQINIPDHLSHYFMNNDESLHVMLNGILYCFDLLALLKL